jgi:hypothetical protein
VLEIIGRKDTTRKELSLLITSWMFSGMRQRHANVYKGFSFVILLEVEPVLVWEPSLFPKFEENILTES